MVVATRWVQPIPWRWKNENPGGDRMAGRCWQLPLGRSVPTKKTHEFKGLEVLNRKKRTIILIGIYFQQQKSGEELLILMGGFQPKDLQGYLDTLVFQS